MRLHIVLTSSAELVAVHDTQFVKGGVLVQVEPPPGLALFDEVDLDLEVASGVLRARGQVVQLIAGVGVAVAFDPKAVPGLLDAVEAARGGGAPALGSGTYQRPSSVDKIQQALHGNKDERAAIVRETNKMLHQYVLRNPNLQLDEVLAFAKSSNVGPDFLRMIAERREWVQRPEIALALVRNPKLPVPIAIKVLDHVAAGELRQLAKAPGLREAIARAARKKVIG